MNESADGAIAFVLGEEQGESIARHLHEDGKIGLKAVFPINLKPERSDVEGFASGVICDSERRNDALLRQLRGRLRRFHDGSMITRARGSNKLAGVTEQLHCQPRAPSAFGLRRTCGRSNGQADRSCRDRRPWSDTNRCPISWLAPC